MAELTNQVWEISPAEFPASAALDERLRFLLRYAILAPSVKNTQPWTFSVDGARVRIYADYSRSLTVTDPDRRELYLSIGCALENLLVAAEHFGLAHQVQYFPEGEEAELAATVDFRAGGRRAPERERVPLDALVRRRNDNSVYLDESVPPALRNRLLACLVEPDLKLELSDDHLFRRWIDELTFEADRMEFANPGFRRELGRWIGHGVFGAPGIRSRIARMLATRLDIGETVGKQDRVLVASAALLGLVLAEEDTHLVHVRAGQLFERLWLTAVAMGVSVHPMSQTMRTPELREAVAELLPGTGWLPQHLFRIGYSSRQTELRHTPRRPLGDVLRD